MEVVNTSLTLVPTLDLGDAAHATIFAVLTQDDAGEHAVYRAIVNPAKVDSDNRQQVAEMVAHGGEKLTYRAALAYFPNMLATEYRD